MTNSSPEILSYCDIRHDARAVAAVEGIFFEASGRTFAPGAEKEAFRERWLGRYLERWPELALVARCAGDGDVAGYLVGCLDDPSQSPLFADLSYFATFAPLCRRFPAHLHINLAPAWRGHGLGGRLIEAFAIRARQAGAPGMHVVTGAGMRNVGFYARLGFREEGRADWNGRTVVLLGCPLDSA